VKPGIYHIHFSGGYSQNFGDGIGVLTDGAINGGDPGYVWRGSFRIADGRISAKIHVKRWKHDISNPLANLAEYDLILEGQVADDLSTFSAEGHIEQYPSTRITLKGTRIDDAA
jgi:hypothetical protein